jgi:hypothetical protein
VSAAREAIGDADFFLVARTDARGVNAKYGLEVRPAQLWELLVSFRDGVRKPYCLVAWG